MAKDIIPVPKDVFDIDIKELEKFKPDTTFTDADIYKIVQIIIKLISNGKKS